MRRADWHVFQVLTKRDERLRGLLQGELRWMADLHHLAFGVSVEDRRYGLPRIRSLQDTPAKIRFLSVEPLLADLGSIDLTGIDWVIVGGESGPHARPMLREWVVQIRRQCRAQRVPFFFKQWGGTRKRVHFVVVFNLTRFARDKYDHFALRSHLQSLGISLRSATEPIDDTSTGKLMEGVLAAFAQFDNDCRSDRTRAGMKAALELGRWVFLAPIGYLNAPRAMGKSLMPDPERAPLVRRAFEEYATGRFTKQQLLKQSRAWGLTNRRGRPLTSQAIGVLLRNQLYAGIVDVPEYGVRAKRSDFEPLISEDLFYRVQAVLSGRLPSTTPQQRAHPDFPLRGFVRCESCGRGLTGSWSKGRSAYYHCRPGCLAVNVTKAKLEGLFADELALLQPTPATCGY